MDDVRLSELIDRVVDNACTEVEALRLRELLRESPRARALYWECMHRHAMIGELLREKRGMGMALVDFRAARRRRLRRSWMLVAAGAAALLLAAVGALALLGGREAVGEGKAGRLLASSALHTSGQQLEYGQELRTLWEQPLEVRLADESRMQVGEESVVSVPRRRRVELGDEGLIDPPARKSHPVGQRADHIGDARLSPLLCLRSVVHSPYSAAVKSE